MWQPPGLEPEQVLQYFNVVPPEAVPVVGTESETKFRVEISNQMPQHDFNPDMCHALTEVEKDEFGALQEIKNNAHRVGVVKPLAKEVDCAGCRERIETQSLAVEVVFKEGRHFHPQCFKCVTCDSLCVGLNSFIHEDQVYCGRHFNDLFKARCAACDESILEESFVKAEGKSWHVKHFCCQRCDVHLAGKRYVHLMVMNDSSLRFPSSSYAWDAIFSKMHSVFVANMHTHVFMTH